MKKRTVLISLAGAMVVALEAMVLLNKPKVDFQPVCDWQDPQNIVEVKKEAALQIVKFEEPIPVLARQAEEKPLGLELIGTAIGNGKDPSAFIKDLESGQQAIYKKGHSIREARIVKITMGQVVFDLNGKETVLTMNAGSRTMTALNNDQIISQDGDQIIVDKKGLMSESWKVFKDLKQVKVSPYYSSEREKVAGLKVKGLSPDNILATAGIHNEDVVTVINSQKIDSYQKALQVLAKAKGQSEITVSVLRDGQTQLLCYKLQ